MFLKNKNLTKTEFCRLCEIRVFTFDRIMVGNGNVKLATLFKVANILGVQMSEILCERKYVF